jgi:hypothetical protein
MEKYPWNTEEEIENPKGMRRVDKGHIEER